MTGREQAELSWRDGAIPVSTRFDDPYFSLAGGLEETFHVFLSGNDLPARLTPGFHVAELGFGTGLNLIALHLSAPGLPLRFTTFEGFPMTAPEMARAHRAFPQAAAVSAPLLDAWGQGARAFDFHGIAVTVLQGDVRQTLPAWGGRADAWFLDGFSPAKNPEMWGEDLMAQVASHTAPGGTFATYTAAGHVRRALSAAGFVVERRPGFGTKRHMSAGRMPGLAGPRAQSAEPPSDKLP
ncbi:tRNA (5-methylaminomethyl-2-thiouridine)(34)-methyltransferase MnmD [Stagnihabitans tardus]|uniref:tRNA (5-methylaminomethyl-2-thiouridine)(34)-methyltransferase MnmD n=1 Tax=Stagnihabitans tardus TaxID=2699202 RepID=A0AAE4Y7M2_9RHOB|nr:tRNA (5-methylaminomethyl-2-thiouridine)(34)-methyltransferase MnmD [Stagnihabitans tardus]NBZ87402.1 tRNA (5-methylaminomethyl-2-thiouridine)(34)-methyltransferase MnmD [Stagnihabitans tardus]